MVQVNGIELRARVDGQAGAPWLVFSNSLMTDLRLWDGEVERLGAEYRILRYDQRGHGGSAIPPNDCNFNVLADDLAALMVQHEIASATIVGVSMGGVTVLALAARHPNLVARAAICDCGSASNPAGAAAWDERIEVARRAGMAALIEPTLARWFRPATLQQAGAPVSLVRRMISETPVDGFVRAARALQDYDLRPSLPGLRVPVALIVGANDAALPQAMTSMAAAIAGAVLTVIPECGHLPNLERKQDFGTALRSLLAR